MKRRVRGQKMVLMSVLGWANLRYHLWNWAIGMPLMLSIGAVSYAGLPNSLQNERDLITFTGTWSGYWFRFADESIVYEQVPVVDIDREPSNGYDGGIILDGHYVIEETIRHAEGRLLEVALYDADGQLLTRVASPNRQPTFELTLRFEFDSITDVFRRFRAIQPAQVTKKIKIKVGTGELEITIPQGPKEKAKLACLGSSDSPNGPSQEMELDSQPVSTCDGSPVTIRKQCRVGNKFSIPSGEAANGMVCVKDEERLQWKENTCTVDACQQVTITWKQAIAPMVRHAVVHWVDKDGNQVKGPKVYDIPFTSYSPCSCDERLRPCPPPCPPDNCSVVIRVVDFSLSPLNGVEVVLSGSQASVARAVSVAGLVVFPNLAAGQYRVAINPESLRPLGIDPEHARIIIIPETLMIPEPCPTATVRTPQRVVILIVAP
jgi:hypothetical protein